MMDAIDIELAAMIEEQIAHDEMWAESDALEAERDARASERAAAFHAAHGCTSLTCEGCAEYCY